MKVGDLSKLDQSVVPHPPGRNVPINLLALRTHGPAALDVSAFPAFRKITLIELEVARGNLAHEIDVIRADDIFECESETPGTIPRTAEYTRAVFKIEFPDAHFILIEMTPTTLSCPPGPDAVLVEAWLVRSPFNNPAPAPGAQSV